MVHRVMDEEFWKRTIIHQVCNIKDSSLKGKQIVLDPTNAAEFPSEDFICIYSQSSYVVDSTTSQIEFHLFVFVDCPFTDDELRNVIAKSAGNCLSE